MSHSKKNRPAALLALAMAGVMLLTAGFAPARGRVTLGGGDSDDTEYELYTSDTACFRLEYPAGSEVSQEDGAVYFASGNFIIGAQFVYSLNDEVFVYSAADMASQLFNSEELLEAWTGAEDLDIVETGKMGSGDSECYRVDYTCYVDDQSWSGCLLVFDGLGEFGCYCLQALIRDDDDAEARWAQFDHVAASFQVTDAYQTEGMTVYEVPDWELEFMVQDMNLSDIEYTNDPIGQSLRLQPAGTSLSQGSVLMDKLTYGPEEDIEDIMNESLDFILSSKEDAEVVSEPDTEQLIGRNPAGIYLASYTDRGATVYTVHVYIGSDDGWWSMIGTSDEDHLEAVMSTMSDVLLSARFGGGDNVKVNKSVAAILDRIEGLDGFEASGYPQPRGSVTDVNGDGRMEFLAVYECLDGGDMYVMYDVWSIREGGAQLLDEGRLYADTGASMGTVFLYERDGVDYLCKWVGTHDDQANYISHAEYIPLSEDEGELLFDEALVLDSVSPDSGHDEYYINGEEVSADDFSEEEGQFTLRVVLNWFGGAFAAPGDDTTPFDSMMSFDELREYDFGS